MSDFRFSPRKVRQAGLPSTAYAKALKALWNHASTPADMRRIFGPDVVDYLERNGYIEVIEGKYYLTAYGIRVLANAGYPPQEQEAAHGRRIPT